MNDKNYNGTAKKLHDSGWKNSIFTTDYVSMLGHVCGLSQYPHFYDQHLEKYQYLPCPYLGSF